MWWKVKLKWIFQGNVNFVGWGLLEFEVMFLKFSCDKNGVGE